jgi:hypothetical protein
MAEGFVRIFRAPAAREDTAAKKGKTLRESKNKKVCSATEQNLGRMIQL